MSTPVETKENFLVLLSRFELSDESKVCLLRLSTLEVKAQLQLTNCS